MRHQISLKRPPALQDLPGACRCNQQHAKRKSLARNPPGEIPDQRQHGQAHQEHRQPERELAQAQHLDKRNHQAGIEGGHL